MQVLEAYADAEGDATVQVEILTRALEVQRRLQQGEATLAVARSARRLAAAQERAGDPSGSLVSIAIAQPIFEHAGERCELAQTWIIAARALIATGKPGVRDEVIRRLVAAREILAASGDHLSAARAALVEADIEGPRQADELIRNALPALQQGGTPAEVRVFWFCAWKKYSLWAEATRNLETVDYHK